MKKLLGLCCAIIFYGQIAYAYKYDLAVCGMFQNESRFLKEWIDFYRVLGVQHFYLYNNKSTDEWKSVLFPYMKDGIVEVTDWNYSNENLYAQNMAYNDVLAKSRGCARWVAFLDLDEYLFPCNDDNLVHFLQDYQEFGGVCANWVMFGTSGVKKIPDGELMIEYLTLCDKGGNKHIKSIVRPECVDKFINPHFALYKKGFFQVNTDKVSFQGPYSPYIQLNALRINHYWTRDEYHLYNVKLPRAETLKTNLMVLDDDSWYIPKDIGRSMSATEWTLAVSDMMNTHTDTAIQRFLPSLKAASCTFIAHK